MVICIEQWKFQIETPTYTALIKPQDIMLTLTAVWRLSASSLNPDRISDNVSTTLHQTKQSRFELEYPTAGPKEFVCPTMVENGAHRLPTRTLVWNRNSASAYRLQGYHQNQCRTWNRVQGALSITFRSLLCMLSGQLQLSSSPAFIAMKSGLLPRFVIASWFQCFVW
jgi:hypothetical protein